MRTKMPLLAGILVAVLFGCASPQVLRVPSPGIEGPAPTTGTILPQLGPVGPTENLTKVANAFTLRHRSLTTLVTVAPGLALTQPVEISIGYFSPKGIKRITQFYAVGTGNRFLYNDPEGNGRPRRMRVDISLREPKPGGEFHTFAFSAEIDLDLLYDVTLSPLQFTLLNDCDWVGKSEIVLEWWSPDDQDNNSFISFSTRADKTTTVAPFAWARTEVSAAADLRRPVVWFWEDDGFIQFVPGYSRSATNLVPGQTKTVETLLTENEAAGGFFPAECYASIQYTITYTVRWYPNL